MIGLNFVDVVGYMDGDDRWYGYTNVYFGVGHVQNRLDQRST